MIRLPSPVTAVAVLLLPGALLAGCGHTTHASAHPAGPATRRVVIRPVTKDGRPAAGFTVTPGKDELDCGSAPGDAHASAVAVDPGIVQCFPVYLAADACWPAGTHRVLCLLDPASTTLTSLTTSGPVGQVAAVPRPYPVALELTDRTRCRYGTGGTMPTLPGEPRLVTYYDCADGQKVWSGAESYPIDEGAATWQVELAPVSGAGGLHSAGVRTAYYVGTATS
ncbi:MAG TPA: hypothetical protein VMB79_06890, partial [Jatrophihabitans sp.]|nr:hypothetical protein [Jatrophihabitans sp.]